MSFYDDASWLLVPSGIKEDVIYAQKPSSGLGDLVMTRASDATYTDSTGVVRKSPYNLFQRSEEFNDGAWFKQQVNVSTNVAANPLTGIVNADLLIPDTTSNNHRIFQLATAPVSNVLSVYAKAAGYNYISFGHAGGVNGSGIIFDLSNGTVSGSLVGFSGTISPAGNGWYLCSLTQSGATNDYQNFSRWIIIRDNSTNLVFTGDGTSGVLVANAQLVEGTSALDYFPTTNRQDVPRIDFRNADGTLSSCGRLLLEPQRTNSIRNSSMVGAVAGTPGTLPTNWAYDGGTLAYSVTGVGVENGLPYTDIRVNGTANLNRLRILFEGAATIAASNGQSWSLSPYVRVTNATSPPLNYNLQMFENTSAGALVTVGSVAFTPTANLTRYNFVRTLSGGATVAVVQPMIQIGLTVGATYDFTIRIAAPQMELGTYATTWVPTTTAAVTRIADAASRSIPSIISASGGTFLVDSMPTISTLINQTIGTVNDGSTSRGFWLGMDAGTLALRYRNGATVIGIGGPTITNGQRIKAAVKWDGTNFTLFANGVKYSTITSGHPSTINSVALNGDGSFFGINQHMVNQSLIASIPLSDAECIQLTTL